MKNFLKNLALLAACFLIVVAAAWAFKRMPAKEMALAYPLSDFNDRPKLLTFGLYVTPDPEQNPIDPPERFVGYHTALDLEILDGEEGKDVDVFAICAGNVIAARTAEGYGGVLVQACTINGQAVTVLYGHIDPSSFTKQAGNPVAKGEKIAVLGDGRTAETGDTRKHLHLGIHKGSEEVLAGYVQTQTELENYIDPLPLFK
jgi:murein DD-endopeptidase MepM/ murein hydrolase activator NlpD